MDNDDERDGPELFCRHLIICRNVWYDASKLDEGFSLGKLFVQASPKDGDEFPILVPRLFAFAQLYGSVGEYRLRVRLVRIDRTELGGEEEMQLGTNGDPLEYVPIRPFELTGLDFVEAIAIPMHDVGFARPAVFEFQLWVREGDEPLARERLEIRG